jgi:aminopeptidase
MQDPRIPQLARQLVHYSTAVKKGEKVMIHLVDVPDEIGVALIKEVRARKGIPFIKIEHGLVSRAMSMNATDEQYKIIAKHQMAEMKDMDAYIALRGSSNICENSDVPTARMKTIMSHMRKVLNQRVDHTKWCVLRWPHPSMAQQAGMSTEAFENFYFDVCLFDYKSQIPAMNALKRMVEKTDQVHIVGNGTDLRFSLKGIPALISAGNYNVPDGEVFTSPVKDSAEGVIQYNVPSLYQGIPFDNIRFEFQKGKIVKAEAGAQTKALNKILDSDPGARYIGEFALGLHPLIKEPMRDILFDEKIAGSFHFTPGQAYEDADNGNRSQVHWDLVNIQRKDYGGGEIYFDGKLIRKNGQFLAKSLQKLNF